MLGGGGPIIIILSMRILSIVNEKTWMVGLGFTFVSLILDGVVSVNRLAIIGVVLCMESDVSLLFVWTVGTNIIYLYA